MFIAAVYKKIYKTNLQCLDYVTEYHSVKQLLSNVNKEHSKIQIGARLDYRLYIGLLTQFQIMFTFTLIFDTMFYDSVCLKDQHGYWIQVLVSECDDFECSDVTSMTSQSRDVIYDVTNRRAVGTFL